MIASETQVKARLEECRGCPHSHVKLKQTICSRCGCIINVKARFIALKCPEDRWPETTPPP